jgi:TRAP-type mannitol/chloroaromatic compound transport system permease small subunit
MSTGGGSASDAHLTGSSILWRLCRAIDLLNTWVARFFGATILVVTFAILYEVVARGVFNRPTIWANETSIYLSAAAYLLGGGYGLLRLGHVRIDLVYGVLSPGPRRVADIVGFI